MGEERVSTVGSTVVEPDPIVEPALTTLQRRVRTEPAVGRAEPVVLAVAASRGD